MKSYIKILVLVLMPLIFTVQANCTKKINFQEDALAKEPKKSQEVAFKHPGIVNSEDDLNYIAMEANPERLNMYNKMVDFITENAVPYGYPSVVYVKASGGTPTEDQIRRDANLAYAYALKWAKTGDVEDAKSAIKILNGWAKNFLKYDVTEGTQIVQAQLEAAWVSPSFAAAAEIIRHYKVNGVTGAGWSAGDIDDFSGFLINLRNNYIKPLVEDLKVSDRRKNNWGTSAGYAKMAIGVFLDSKADYDDGKRILLELLPFIIKPDGEVFELCSRDCHHPQYAMSGLTLGAEIARVQSDESIYLAESERIMKGWEWIWGAFSGQVSCRTCVGEQVYSAVELAANYYNSIKINSLAGLQRLSSGIVTDHTFLGFTSYSHLNTKNK